MSRETYSKPSDVVAEEGRVLVDGPDSVDVAFTPEAAQVTGERLIDAAAVAAFQRDEADRSAAEGGDQGDQPGGET